MCVVVTLDDFVSHTLQDQGFDYTEKQFDSLLEAQAVYPELSPLCRLFTGRPENDMYGSMKRILPNDRVVVKILSWIPTADGT
jgi:hypothetical protein